MNYQTLANLENWLAQQIVGQHDLIHKLMLALLADGHLLVEGAPGLAKTRAIKEMAAGIEGSFHRIQFTPDLLPGDITGTDIFRPQTGAFEFQQGPIFNNLVLADEINRAPAKVQSALLEAMAERQVSIGSQTYTLPDLFLVMATQNPIEQEGTYPLPEAQLDRFLMHVRVSYPDAGAEQAILKLARNEATGSHSKPEGTVTQKDIFSARQAVLNIIRNAVEAGATSLKVSCARIKREVQIAIEDDGPGMSEEERSRAFDPFFSTKASGTGLGLAITRQILEDHDGSVRVVSTTAGTTITLVLPDRRAPTATAADELPG